MAGSSKGMNEVLLRTADGGAFVVPRSVAAEIVAISHEIEGGGGERAAGIFIPNVTRPILMRILQFLYAHDEMVSNLHPADLEMFDKEFLNVSSDFLYHILLAAYHLKIVRLRDLACQKVADMMKGKSIDEIRTTFNLPNEYSGMELAEIRRMYPWIFEHQIDDENRMSVDKDKYIENKEGTTREEEICVKSKEGVSKGKGKQVEGKGSGLYGEGNMENKEGISMENDKPIENSERDKGMNKGSNAM